MKTFFLIVFLFCAYSLDASTFVYMDMPELVDRSEIIIRGTVKDIESRYNEERTKIFTYTIIDVKEAIKGKSPPVITVRTFGGRVGDVNMKVPGMPEFKKGEEVFLFLKKNEDFYHVSGMIQGKYSIEKDESGKEFLRNDFKGVSFKKINSEKKLEDMKPEEILDRFEYNDFVLKIKEILTNKSNQEKKK